MKPQGDAGRIAAMAGQWRGAAGRVQSLASGLDGAVPAGWSGSAHAAFVGTWGDLKGQSATAAGAMAIIGDRNAAKIASSNLWPRSKP